MSAHVLPKVRAFDPDEDEKTTIESGWEEEASTTVEQGEVAAKLRALGSEAPVPLAPQRSAITGVTSTNATSLEEPTVDGGLAQIPVLTPAELIAPAPHTSARLVCTSGNDSGREYDIRPGKSYSIGRAIDNDVVLTDIAVSRKHFDLRHENGAWVLVDRGSGNGTVVNGNLEDAPFLLASGDAIEIGNTIFRFDLPNAGIPAFLPSARSSAQSYDLDLDSHSNHSHQHDDEEEEPSTVAGKPLREVGPFDSGTPVPGDHYGQQSSTPPYVPPVRPKTLPPPTPMRPRSNSANAVAQSPYAQGTPGVIPMISHPAPSSLPPPAPLPMPPQVEKAPPGAVTSAMANAYPSQQPTPQSTLPMPQQMGGVRSSGHPAAQQPTMLADQPKLPPGYEGYEQAMHAMQAHHTPPMQPTGYDPYMQPTTLPGQAPPLTPARQMPPFQGQYPLAQSLPPQSAPSEISRPSGPRLFDGGNAPMFDSGMGPAVPAANYAATPNQPLLSRRTKLILGALGLALFAALVTIAIIKGTASSPDEATADFDDTGSGDKVAKPDHDKTEEPKTAKNTKIDVQPIVVPKTNTAQTNPTPTPTPTPTPAPKGPVVAFANETHTFAHVFRGDGPVPEVKEVKDVAPTPRPRPNEPVRPTPTPTPTPTPPPQPQVSTVDLADLKAKASALYRQRNFSGAAAVLAQAKDKLSARDRTTALSYAAYYNRVDYGFARAAGKADEAYPALVSAKAADLQLEGAYVSELDGKITQIAAKAALALALKGQLTTALSALHVAESSGVGADTAALARSTLDKKARDLLAKAAAEPAKAKDYARQVLTFVDTKSPNYEKAKELLQN